MMLYHCACQAFGSNFTDVSDLITDLVEFTLFASAGLVSALVSSNVMSSFGGIGFSRSASWFRGCSREKVRHRGVYYTKGAGWYARDFVLHRFEIIFAG
eukprot:CAMPEP_0181394918 /NCGR_PEP_ID=MMETSP1106-20121128/28038_1 /TAXON_ID=81844 /ORGANISM="Mantoniella antarctica, Strain SL-175" /LENGTH=98 /DNA_ID=CAMNT_0023516455 /DNA_START=528 /DNA_END=824 /DNA_ORIENTATION=-